VNSIVDIECKLQFPHSVPQGLVINHKVLIVQGHVVFIERRLQLKHLLQFWLIMDGSRVEEDIVVMLESKVGSAVEVGLPSRNHWEVDDHVSHL
jgi:hypothetical protein